MPRLIILSGNSGVGKTYIINNFNLLSDNVQVVQKKTTRPARSYESKDKTIELIFYTPKRDILNMDFKYGYREYYYGFNRSSIDQILAEGQSPILVIRSVDCVRELKSVYKTAISILVKAENKNLIYEKLNKLGCHPAEIQQRINPEYELELEREYEANIDLFECVVYNSYTNRFILDLNNKLNSY